MAYTTIDNPELYFQVKLYAGTGSSGAHTLDGDEDMQPNMIWFKSRDATESHLIVDSVRGSTKRVRPDTNNAEDDQGSHGIQSFDSDGFTTGTGDNNNKSSDNYVAWCWKETATAGFDIVAYTGNATDRTISHSLSAVPKVIIVKRRTGGDSQWAVYHHTLTNNYFMVLNTAGASETTDHWNDTDPTSSVFSINSTGDEVNVNTSTYIAYLWAEKQGFSKFGSYGGNSNADGSFIYTGFRPAWVMVKKTTSANDEWNIFDNKRDPFNVMTKRLVANVDGADAAGTYIDFVSNGFKARTSNNLANGTGLNYIYMAFAEAPFVNSKGVPCNAR